MATTRKNSETEVKNPSPRGRKAADLSDFYEFAPIAQKLATGNVTKKNMHAQLSAIKRVFQNAEGFAIFYRQDKDTKGKFLADWVESYIKKRVDVAQQAVMDDPENQEKIEELRSVERSAYNTGWLGHAWTIQGFFSHILDEKTAINTSRFPQQLSTGGEPIDIELADILALYEVLSPKYKVILKIQVLYGANSKDIINLKASDFMDAGDGFYYINKLRIKEKQKNSLWFAIVPAEIVQEVEAIGKVEGRSISETVFNIKRENAILMAYQYKCREFGLKEVQPGDVRHWNADILKKVIKMAAMELYENGNPDSIIDTDSMVHYWTQHNVKDVIDANYIRTHIAQMKKAFPWIAESLLIDSTTTFKKKVAEIKQEAKDLVAQQKAELEKVRNEGFKNANQTMEMFQEFMRIQAKKSGIEITPRRYTNDLTEEEKNAVLTDEMKDILRKITQE